ncbi:hypothetical protein ACFGVS_03125 [Mucilaginibacter sp. AW1-7]|uniref:hypothetical protein n=1 Tax=Mucilaginibacter sp. AW1-7 TaxID=3349874 RepID=UPI003F73B352
MKYLTHHINHLTIYAIVLLVIGLLICYTIGRRRFNRRGVAGLQYFNTYARALIITNLERLLNLIGMLLIIVAIILYLIR